MTEAARVAFIMSQVVCAQAEIEGMIAENKWRETNGDSLAYGEEAFFGVPKKYGLEHNEVISYLRGD